jgi:hypothetical protein
MSFLLANSLPFAMLVGLVAGLAAAHILHSIPGVSLVLAVAGLTLLGAIASNGGLGALEALFNDAMELAKKNDVAGQGVALGALAYTVYAAGWHIGHAAALSKLPAN